MARPKPSMKGFPDRSVTIHPVPVSSLDLHSKRLLVVGGTDGLGRAIAKLAASRGAQVTVVGRTFRDEGTAGLSFVKGDLSSMKEAERLGRELPVESTDVVLLTTGIMAATTREVTSEGLERDMAISYLSRLALLRPLAPRLGTSRGADAPPARVFVMGFPGTGQLGDADDLNSEKSYDAFPVHMNTVAGNEVLVLDGARRYPSLRLYGLNPGLIKTNIRANFLGEQSLKHRLAEFVISLLNPSPEKYAERIVPLLFAPELTQRTGLMFGAKANPILPTEGLTDAYVAKFIAGSEALVARAVGRAA